MLKILCTFEIQNRDIMKKILFNYLRSKGMNNQGEANLNDAISAFKFIISWFLVIGLSFGLMAIFSVVLDVFNIIIN